MESTDRGDHVGASGMWSTEPVYIGWKEWGPFWFPGLPLAIIFLIALILTSGWVRGLFAVLAVASAGLLIPAAGGPGPNPVPLNQPSCHQTPGLGRLSPWLIGTFGTSV